MNFVTPKVEQIGPNNFNISHGDDKSLWVEFRSEPVLQGFESEAQGRPVYKDVDYIHIDFPGDRTKTVDRPVDLQGNSEVPGDPVRFPRQWEAFKAQREQAQDGCAITEWPPLTKSQALELKAMKIHTVEQLAALPDTALSWLGARELRTKALTWLDNAQGGAITSKLTAENESLRADLEMMKKQIAELGLNVETAQKRGPGRPPKTEGE